MNLTEMAATASAAHRHFATIGSTNAAALEWATETMSSSALRWVTADAQTEGRGRRGRPWVSEPGNLYATALWNGESQSIAANLPLRAVLALHDAVLTCLPELSGRLSLKWPNDLMLDGAKLSGILLEAVRLPERTIIAIGFGVNCHHHPALTALRTTSLRSAGFELVPAVLFARLSETLPNRLTAPDATVLEDWRGTAQGIGAPIVVRLPNQEIEGIFEDLADDGRLVLARPDGSTQMIAAGDVFFPSTQGPPMTEAIAPDRSVPHE